ncbi:MAG TPA: cupin domain-containing protein [Usitatibacter sp.]|nr:cupin domain-containing protein [Usitatibacter sp.]
MLENGEHTQQPGGRPAPGTLGEVLYGSGPGAVVPEADWAGLVRGVARGEAAALHELFERAHRLVYALAVHLGASPDVAEEVTVDVFLDIWRRAWNYDPESCTVLAWIMNQARSRCLVALPGAKSADRAVSFAAAAVPRSSLELHVRLANRIAAASGRDALPPPLTRWSEPPWDEVAPGILCKIFADDAPRHRVSMLVRLQPGVEYPPHQHAGLEELHLLEGELWIDDRKLRPGDYNRAQAPSGDKRVWSETGCMCMLATSTDDVLA